MSATADTEAFAAGLERTADALQLGVTELAHTARLTEATVRKVLEGGERPCPRVQELLAFAVGSSAAALYELGSEW